MQVSPSITSRLGGARSFRQRIFGIEFAICLFLIAGILAWTGFRPLSKGSEPVSLINISQFELAQQFEKWNQPQTAYNLYAGLVKHLPAADRQWRAVVHYRLGECLLRLGRPADAFQNFQNAAFLDPANAAIHLHLGELLLANGEPEKAFEQVTVALRAGNRDTEALALLGAAALGAGQPQMAESALREVLAADPGRVKVAIGLAELYSRENRLDAAREALAGAARAQSGSALPLLVLARMEEEAGHLGPAENDYRQAVSRENTVATNELLAQFLARCARVEDTEAVLRNVDWLQPAQAAALADFRLLTGNTRNAVDLYFDELRMHYGAERAPFAARLIEADLQLDPAVAARISRLHFDAYRGEMDSNTANLLESEIDLAADDVTSAENKARQAVQKTPHSAAAHYTLGIAEFRAGETARARTEWLRALDEDDNYVPARMVLAEEALRNSDSRGAEDYLAPVIHEESGNLGALQLYARILLAQHRLEAAQAMALRAAAVDDKSALTHVLMAQIADAQGDLPSAMTQFGRATALDPRSIEAMNGLLNIYRRGPAARAVMVRLETSAMSAPQSPVLLEVAGRLYGEHHWLADAERCFRKALDFDPGRATAAAALAQTLAQRGEAAAAAETIAGNIAGAVLAGAAAEQRNDQTGATAKYELAVRQGDDTGVAANNLAWIYAQNGVQLERALSLALKANALSPGNPAVLDTLGFVYLRRREFSQAVSVLQKAATVAALPAYSRQPELAGNIHEHLAEARLHAGIPESANDISITASITSTPLPKVFQSGFEHRRLHPLEARPGK